MTRRKLKLAYFRIPNMGDLLNELLMEQVFHVPFERVAHEEDWDLIGIGSAMDRVFPRRRPDGIHPLWAVRRFRDEWLRPEKPRHVWGTGFIEDPHPGSLPRRQVRFLAMRGRLTRRWVEKIQGRRVEAPLGDGGILASMLLPDRVAKTVEVGIVPHYREQDAPQVQWLRDRYPDARLINLREDPLAVVRAIAECEQVFSSSLHGLVVADAFHIPNLRVKFTDAPLGTGFKFDDYYSAYGLEAPAFVIERDRLPDPGLLRKNYRVRPDAVEAMKRSMYEGLQTYLTEQGFAGADDR